MVNIQQYARSKKAISNDDIRTLILQNGKLDRKELADKANRKAATIWNWINERTNFPAYGIPFYTEVTGDTCLLDAICRACGYIAVPIIHFKEIDKALTKLEIEISIAAGKLFEEIENDTSPQSAKGKEIDRLEAKRIIKKGRKVVRLVRAIMLLAEEQAK